MLKKTFVKIYIKLGLGLLISVLFWVLMMPIVFSVRAQEIPINVGNLGSVHLLLGNPSDASLDGSDPNNLLMIKRQYALSYNGSKSIANWVSWQLGSEWLGEETRCQNPPGRDYFRPDTALPSGYNPVFSEDYTGTGFDRGHIIPSSDRTNNHTDNCATFLMTNIMPQSPDVNQGPWKTLEEQGRYLVNEENKKLYIIAGGTGKGGEGREGFKYSFTGKRSLNTIAVPASSWKVMVVLEQPQMGLAEITENTRIIAVNMPHKQGVRGDCWNVKENGSFKYITSVDEIEKLTGYDLLSNLPKEIQDVIEAKADEGLGFNSCSL
ncbi:DNA/RNA non-specific endonuclease [Gloeothece verrucosa]|uniref:DNA/RNA non-specific endonuclease n=1 Tax=Gloeothece verrucosa (strain PCC 7822) TaxID=497965 RepID=E0ULD8_GLOV7|nr:DNA/RNA non-specific endonuclease [Gloeothece verrucosa]ADN17768.1 DNA/RNA non-specific endonuclease [Gloeothece verrucosa PCC 7822]